MRVNFNFKDALPSDQRNCAALIKRVSAAAAEWPARWTKAKTAGDKSKMQRLLREAEALGMIEKVLRAAEIQMRSAILTRQQGANKALREHNRHKAAKAGASFAKLLPLVHERHKLEEERKSINGQSMKVCLDYMELMFKEYCGGVSR
jgi:hypothetical protein